MLSTNTHSTQIVTSKYFRYVLSGVLFIISILALWPYYQYYIDPDAVCYLNLAKNYLNGRSAFAINAYWGPLGIWLTALWGYVSGWTLFKAAIFCNSIGALSAFIASQILFDKFRKNKWEQWCFSLCMLPFWSYVVYLQSFDDPWQIFLLLLGLLVLLKNRFEHNILLWIAMGIIGALSYFGKASSFYFFPVMILVAVSIKLIGQNHFSVKKIFTIFLVCEVTLLICITPWLWLIHQRYGFWTVTTAAPLNMSWALVDGSHALRKGISTLYPLPNKHALYYWEEPLKVQSHISHFWDSPALLLRLISITKYNILIRWAKTCNSLSAFYFIVWFLSIAAIFSRQLLKKHKTALRILIIIFLAYPLPFFLSTFAGGRYIWFTVPLCPIIGLMLFEVTVFKFIPKWFTSLFVFIFITSFSVHPIFILRMYRNVGQRQFLQATRLKELHIHGSFVTNLPSPANGQMSLTPFIWFSGNQCYYHMPDKCNYQEIIQDAKRYHVKYFFYLYKDKNDTFQLPGSGKSYYTEIAPNQIPGLKIFYLGF